jgi:ferrous-iron efflux pump FieF
MNDKTETQSTGGGIAHAVTLTAMAVASILFLMKLAAWILSDSVAVLAGLMDSSLDLVSSGAAFIAVRVGATPPDDNHRFGHQKAEAVSALIQTVLIAASGTLVLVESLRRLIEPAPIEEAGPAILALGAATLLTIALVGFQTLAIRRSGSLVITADRAHYTGDVFSNAGLLIAVVLTARFGLERADALAGLLAAGFLFWSVREVAAQALPQLMDEELPKDERAKLEAVLGAHPDAHGFKTLRTRKAGARRFIQVDVIMPGEMRLSDAHDAAHRIEAELKRRFPGADVTVHQDSGDP